jgi:hypothetical protein
VITAVGAASAIPLEGMAPAVAASAEKRADLHRLRYRFVSPTYFDVFEIGIVEGRPFTADEARAGAAVAVISQTAARQLWPDGGAIGKSLHVVADTRTPVVARIRRYATVTVIGFARDTAADIDHAGPVTAAVHFPIEKRYRASGWSCARPAMARPLADHSTPH